MKKFLGSLFQDERGVVSSKRFCGVVCTLVLCVTLFISEVRPSVAMPDTLVEAITALAFGCLGLSTIDKFSLKKVVYTISYYCI